MKMLPRFAVSRAFALVNGHAPVHLLRGVFENEFATFFGMRVVRVDPACDPMTEKYGYNIHAVCDRCKRDVHVFFHSVRFVRCENCVRVCERDCVHDLNVSAVI